MAVLNAGSSDWPSSKDTYTDEVDDPKTAKTRLRAAIVNGIYAWVTNTQNDLGGSLKGSKSDAQTRIAVRHANDGTDLDKIRVLGANSLTTLQDVIDDLTSDAGEVYIPAGTETLTAYAEFETKHRIRGAGAGSLIEGTEGGHKMLVHDQSANIEKVSIQDVAIDGDSPAGAAANREHYHAIQLGDDTYDADDNIIGPTIWIQDVGGDGVYLRRAERNIIHGVNFDINNQAIGANLCGRNGVAFVDGDTLIIANSIFRRAGMAGIDLEPNATEAVKKVLITNCFFEDNLKGIQLYDPNASTYLQEVSISNCWIKVGDNSATGYNSSTWGIHLLNARYVNITNNVIVGQSTLSKTGAGIELYECNEINVCNNTIIGVKRGIQITTVDTITEKVNICGNIVKRCYQHGLSLNGASSYNMENLIIANNQVWNNDISDGGYDGIRVNYFDYAIIQGNISCDDQGTQTQGVGINVSNGSNPVIIGNICYGNTTNQIKIDTCTSYEVGHNIGAVTVA